MSEDIARCLEALINDAQNKELECRLFLQYIKDVLVKNRATRFDYVETERIGNTGRSDYIISAVIEEGGDECTKAYIWELKAPQCPIFEVDTENRLKPSKELIDAENKLLHYYLENKYSGVFHQQYHITNPVDVVLGGIIIGCRRTKVIGLMEEERKNRLYRIIKSSRDIFYGNSGIILLTWDDVVGHIRKRVTEQNVIGSYQNVVVLDPILLNINEVEHDDQFFEENENYDTLEEIFSRKASQIKIKLRCVSGDVIEDWLTYIGVVSSEERGMGPEFLHIWDGEITCPGGDESNHIELEVWEYPQGSLNLAQMPDCPYDVLNKEEIGRIIGIKID